MPFSFAKRFSPISSILYWRRGLHTSRAGSKVDIVPANTGRAAQIYYMPGGGWAGSGEKKKRTAAQGPV